MTLPYNSLLPPELQPMYQQQFGDAGMTYPGEPASEMNYQHGGLMPVSSVTPAYGNQGMYQPSSQMTDVYGDQGLFQTPTQVYQPQPQEMYQAPAVSAPNFESQPVLGHYNPQPFVPRAPQSMIGGIPPPYRRMPVLPPIQGAGMRSVPYRMDSSPAVLQNTGPYTIDGTLEYGQFNPFGETGIAEQLPGTLRQELADTYGAYPHMDVQIAADNGRYNLYASPHVQRELSVRPLSPITRPRFHHSPIHSVRHSMGLPRPVLPRPVTRFSEDFGSVNLSRASNYHNVYRRSPLPLGPSRETVVFSPSPSPFRKYNMNNELIEEVEISSPPPRVYAEYVRSARLPRGPRRIRYRSPARYTTRLFQP